MTSAQQIANGQLTPFVLLDVVLKLGLVLFLIYGSAYLLKRYGHQLLNLQNPKNKPDQAFEILQVQTLQRGVTLYLLQAAQLQILISVSGTEVRQLAQWPSPATQPQSVEDEISHESI